MSNTVLEMAKKAGLFTHKEVQPELQAFANLVRAEENKACAKLCEELAETEWADNERCATAIRNRSNT